MAGEQYQAQEGQKLRKADQPQIEHAAGEVVHLPAHRHDDHLRRDGGTKPRRKIQGEIAVFEDRESAGDAFGTQECGRLDSGYSPRPLNDACSSGRRPSGQRNRRSLSGMGKSLMLAIRNLIRPCSSNSQFSLP